MSWAMRSA